MPSFAQRSSQKELLDGEDIPFADIKQNMQELDFINRNLGGHAITLKGLKLLLIHRPLTQGVRILEIGCGGGDNLRAVQNWAIKRKISVALTGVDINPECIAFATAQPANNGIQFICADYKNAIGLNPDVIFSSLFCHHFTDNELTEQLSWMAQHAAFGFFINDLHRHRVAYNFIKTATALFSKSHLVKHDAPLSVLRGFVRKEWKALFAKAGLTSYECRWRWAFRWLITYRKDGVTR